MSEIKTIYCASLLQAKQIIKENKAEGNPLTTVNIICNYDLLESLSKDIPDSELEPELLNKLQKVINQRRDLFNRLLEGE